MMKASALRKFTWAVAMTLLCACVPMGVAFADDWTLEHDSANDGDTDYRCVHSEPGFFVMPGDSVTFEQFMPPKNTSIGHEVTTTVVGFMVDQDRLTDGIELDAERTASCTIIKDGVQEGDSLEMPYHTTLKNNSTYGLVVSCQGGFQTISGAEYEKGAMLSEDVKKTVGITLTPYAIELPQTWDAGDATFQGKENPNSTRTIWTAGNNPYTFTVANPVMKGKHFSSWEGSGYGTSSTDVIQANPAKIGEDGMGTTTFSYTVHDPSDGWVESEVRDVAVKALFSNGYTITYHCNGGKINGQDEWIYEAHEDAGNYPNWVHAGFDTAPVRNGYTFGGWYFEDARSDDKVQYGFTNLNAAYNGPDDLFGPNTAWQDWMSYDKNGYSNDRNLDVYAKWTRADQPANGNEPAASDQPSNGDEPGKADQPVALKAQSITVITPEKASKTYKAKALKKGTKSFTIKASAKTKVKYTVVKYPTGGNKFIALSKKSGKSTTVTLKKGAKKGTYKVKLTAAKNSAYKAAKACYVTIKVK